MWISAAEKVVVFRGIDDFPDQLVTPCDGVQVDAQREEPATDDEKGERKREAQYGIRNAACDVTP
jgi:hypothetical protein